MDTALEEAGWQAFNLMVEEQRIWGSIFYMSDRDYLFSSFGKIKIRCC